MPIKLFSGKYKYIIISITCFILFLGYYYRIPLFNVLQRYYILLTDREEIKTFISSFGYAGPFVFIFIQVAQVVLAPIPGEATGFIGGYLFGTALGFGFSTIGLTIGSWINFIIGRVFGKRYIRKFIPIDKLKRFDHIIRHQGIVVLFILFIFPGFPKDYLCIILGLSNLPLKVFIVLSTIGRMPGTLLLSLQGASLYSRNYVTFTVIALFCLLAIFFSYRYREALYQWIEKFNDNS